MMLTTLPLLEQDPAAYRALLEFTGAVPWRLDWQTLAFSDIGPQIEALLGWPHASWRGINDWVERIHPDDREEVVEFCISQSRAGTDHEADYRALTAHGEYVWVRDVVHVVRDDHGQVRALMGFMFDISERKQTEAHLARLQKQLEEYAYLDGLTGIANRRMFDTVLDREWANAQRSRQPLSLIMVDIDHFKHYNDHYGHLRGDECLKQVAHTLSVAANRPRDFLARLEGDAFAWLLPETDTAAARQVAERCLNLIRQRQIDHDASPLGTTLNLSLGVGTTAPSYRGTALAFLEKVDSLLYIAKRAGRARAQYAEFRH